VSRLRRTSPAGPAIRPDDVGTPTYRPPVIEE
jgi:hypothetical protein